MSIKIITDSGSQLSQSEQNQNLILLNMPVISGNDEYFEGINITSKDMFSRMKKSEVFKTSQVSYKQYYETFKNELNDGNEIICITLSSGLSSTFQTALMAMNDLLSENKDYKIIVKDSLSACSGQTSVVYKALKLIELNYSFEEISEKLDEIIKSQEHIFTVNNLEYLYRGGRLSKTQKIMGSLLNIRPIIHVDKSNGKLNVLDKARGDKQTYLKIKNLIIEKCNNNVNSNQTVYVCYGENKSQAEQLVEKLSEDFAFKNIITKNLGCVIGAHTGPELLGVFFSNTFLSEELADI
ncbi:DegV family protein [uncultured Finegoldia sp.]|uniref:DegV family protein n=1 Tax=uncultured Finegoldia sp. TaxID=328009 RepID=UPI0026259758|nr:DegV family protein [uncultured Finegoldia sp.]